MAPYHLTVDVCTQRPSKGLSSHALLLTRLITRCSSSHVQFRTLKNGLQAETRWWKRLRLLSETDQPLPFYARLSAETHNCSSRRRREEIEILRSFWFPSCLHSCVCVTSASELPGAAPQGSVQPPGRPCGFSPRLSAARWSHAARLRNRTFGIQRRVLRDYGVGPPPSSTDAPPSKHQ